MMIDSHALLWWLEGDEALSETAAEVLNTMANEGSRFLVSSVTFWEMRMKEQRGLLAPKTSVAEWPQILKRLENLRIVDVSAEIWLLTAELQWDHRDPADRIIAATALKHGMPVLTKDSRFHELDSPVKAVW